MKHFGTGDNETHIPESVEELFDNGDAHYFIKDPDRPGDNIYGMQLFIAEVGIPSDMIELDDGTQIFVSNGKKTLQIDSGGLGDFHLHGFDVTTVKSSISEIKLRRMVSDALDEMTTSGAAGPYMTPMAFRGKHSKKDVAARSMPGGKVVGKDDESDDTTITEDGNRIPTVKKSQVVEGRSRYKNFKESDLMKTRGKISYGINQAKKMLGEVEYLLNICERLKTECDVPTDNLWARTKPDMKEIHSRLKEIAKRINRIGN